MAIDRRMDKYMVIHHITELFPTVEMNERVICNGMNGYILET